MVVDLFAGPQTTGEIPRRSADYRRGVVGPIAAKKRNLLRSSLANAVLAIARGVSEQRCVVREIGFPTHR